MSTFKKKCFWVKIDPFEENAILVLVIETVPVCLKHVTALHLK